MHLRKRLSTAAAIILIIAAALLLTARAGFYLTLRNKDTGKLYARYRMDEGERFSITYKHSVNQYPLTDTFEICDGKLYAEECKYYAYGAGVQVELNPGEELSYTEDGALLITGIHQDRTGVCYAVATVSPAEEVEDKLLAALAAAGTQVFRTDGGAVSVEWTDGGFTVMQ